MASLVALGSALSSVRSGDAELQQEQPAGAAPHRNSLLGLGGHHPQRHAVALVDERGVGRERLTEVGGFERTRDGPDRPRAQPLDLVDRRDRGHRLAQASGHATTQRSQVLAPGQRAPVVVDRPVRHLQVLGELRHVGGAEPDRDAGVLRQLASQDLEERAVRRTDHGQHRASRVRRRGDVPAHLLRQRADERRDEVLAEAGHLPVEPEPVGLVEQHDRDVDGDTVEIVTGLVGVGHRQVDLTQRQPLGKRRVVDRSDRRIHEDVRAVAEEVGPAASLPLPPRLEAAPGGDVGGDALVEEGDEGIVVDQQVASHSVLQGQDLHHPIVVGPQEVVRGVPLPLHERVADEELAGVGGVDALVAHPPLRDDREAVERDALVDRRPTTLRFPPRLAVAAGDEVGRDALDPIGLDRRHRARPKPVRLDELRGHHPLGAALAERRTTGEHEPRLTGAAVVLALLVPHPDVREEPRKQ